MFTRYLSLFFIALSFPLYSQTNFVDIKQYDFLHKDITAASGIEFWNNKYYVVSDNSNTLVVLNQDLSMNKKIDIYNPEDITTGDKADFEALSYAKLSTDKEILLILPSGSRSTRHTGYIYDLNSESDFIEIDLSTLYNYLKDQAKFPENTNINIEGVAISDDKVYLANRGNTYQDFLFILDKEAFFNFIADTTNKIKPSSLNVKVIKPQTPQIGSFTSTLSGLDWVKETQTLYFTTSIEISDDSIHDGLLLGSFTGSMPLSSLKNNVDLSMYSNLIFNEEGVMQTKIESIVVYDSNNTIDNAIIVSDNDGSAGEIFTIEMPQSRK